MSFSVVSLSNDGADDEMVQFSVFILAVVVVCSGAMESEGWRKGYRQESYQRVADGGWDEYYTFQSLKVNSTVWILFGFRSSCLHITSKPRCHNLCGCRFLLIQTQQQQKTHFNWHFNCLLLWKHAFHSLTISRKISIWKQSSKYNFRYLFICGLLFCHQKIKTKHENEKNTFQLKLFLFFSFKNERYRSKHMWFMRFNEL